MPADKLSREQRLRMQAELQSLYNTLVNLREREASYMDAAANVPELFGDQINEIRRKIDVLEAQLFADMPDDATEVKKRKLYRQAFEAEVAGDFSEALKLYKSAGRYSHRDASAAMRSVRYQMKNVRPKTVEDNWLPAAGGGRSANRALVIAALILAVALIGLFIYNGLTNGNPQAAVAVELTPTLALTQEIVQLIIPDTPTPLPTRTPPPTSPPTATSVPVVAPNQTTPTPRPSPTVTPLPTPAPTLRPAPRMVGPKDGLVWLDGAVVIEFQPLNLASDELYCLSTMRGYDVNATENWSYQPIGNEQPYIAIEANVFRVARVQGIQCVIWSAGIGKGSCENIISHLTNERVIGLPRPCNFR